MIVVVTIIAVLALMSILRFMDKKEIEVKTATNIIQATFIRGRDMARSPQQNSDLSVDLDVNGYGVLTTGLNEHPIILKIYKDKKTSTLMNQYDGQDEIVTEINFEAYNLGDAVFNGDDSGVAFNDFFFSSAESPSNEKYFMNGMERANGLRITIASDDPDETSNLKYGWIKIINGQVSAHSEYPTY